MDRARTRQVVIEHRPDQTPKEEAAMQGDDTRNEQGQQVTPPPDPTDWEQIVTF